MNSEAKKHCRRSIRLKEFDYARPGSYFVTICARDRECLFGDVAVGEMRLSEYGVIASACLGEIPKHFPYVRLDAFVVMPNHVHMIVVIFDVDVRVGAQHAAPLHQQQRTNVAPDSLSAIVRSYKSAVTKRVNELRGMPGVALWQRNYYEHIVRNENELRLVREYIVNNPLQWSLDRENPINKNAQAMKDEPWMC